MVKIKGSSLIKIIGMVLYFVVLKELMNCLVKRLRY